MGGVGRLDHATGGGLGEHLGGELAGRLVPAAQRSELSQRREVKAGGVGPARLAGKPASFLGVGLGRAVVAAEDVVGHEGIQARGQRSGCPEHLEALHRSGPEAPAERVVTQAPGDAAGPHLQFRISDVAGGGKIRVPIISRHSRALPHHRADGAEQADDEHIVGFAVIGQVPHEPVDLAHGVHAHRVVGGGCWLLLITFPSEEDGRRRAAVPLWSCGLTGGCLG